MAADLCQQDLTHWTGHASRLDRAFGKRFADKAYAFEELVAELGRGVRIRRTRPVAAAPARPRRSSRALARHPQSRQAGDFHRRRACAEGGRLADRLQSRGRARRSGAAGSGMRPAMTRSKLTPPSQLGFDAVFAEAETRNRVVRFERACGHLPATMEEALPSYRSLIEWHHAAMLDTDGQDANNADPRPFRPHPSSASVCAVSPPKCPEPLNQDTRSRTHKQGSLLDRGVIQGFERSLDEHAPVRIE